MSKTDSALASLNLSEIRKFEQVVTSVLNVTKEKEAQGAIAVFISKTFLAVKEMVWWWGIKVGRIGIDLKLHTPWLTSPWEHAGDEKGEEKERWGKNRGKRGGGQNPIVRPCLFGQCPEASLWLGTITFCFLIEANLPELVIQVKFEEPRALS